MNESIGGKHSQATKTELKSKTRMPSVSFFVSPFPWQDLILCLYQTAVNKFHLNSQSQTISSENRSIVTPFFDFQDV